MFNKNELSQALEQIERDKGIPKEEILRMIEHALVSAYRKHAGQQVNVEAVIDTTSEQIKAYVVKAIVDEVKNPALEITKAEAKKIHNGILSDTHLKIPVDAEEFARIAAQTAKQVLIQKIRETERESLYEEFKPKEGVLINGVVQRFNNRNMIVDLGRAEGVVPVREQIRREKWSVGDRIRVVILKVEKGPRGPEVILSRTHHDLVRRLFEQEVPEIYEKTVEVVNVVREPGLRSKVVVRSNNPKVDPVGACVGVKGSRVRPIIDDLQGERIDLVSYSDEKAVYIANSLSPVKPLSVTVTSHENKTAEVLVSNDQLSLAIGKGGQNVRLAARLTGWQIDVRSEAQKREASAASAAAQVSALSQLENVGPKTAEILKKGGWSDVRRIASSQPSDLTGLSGIGLKTAEKIVESAKAYLQMQQAEAEDNTASSEEEENQSTEDDVEASQEASPQAQEKQEDSSEEQPVSSDSDNA